VFENKVLRRISGPKREEVPGEQKKLHNQELHNVYFSPNIIGVIMLRKIRRTGHVTRMRKNGKHKIMAGKLQVTYFS
jgi:hypothetical protein